MLTDRKDGYFTITELEVWEVEYIVNHYIKLILLISDQDERQRVRKKEKETKKEKQKALAACIVVIIINDSLYFL